MTRNIGRRFCAIHWTPCWIQSPIGKTARSSALNMACSHGARSADSGKDLPCFQTADQAAGFIDYADRAAVFILLITAGDIDELGVRGHAGETRVGPGHAAAAARLFHLRSSPGAENAFVRVEHEPRARLAGCVAHEDAFRAAQNG